MKRSEVTGEVLEGETAKGRLHGWMPALDPGWLPESTPESSVKIS
jgi:hypothetical protein